MGLEFGHRLGLPGALSALPLSPLVDGYQELVARQRALGLSHIGQALAPAGARLRVLDGVFVSRAPRGWKHVNSAQLRKSAAENPVTEALVQRVAELCDQDPTALRRVLLYQLIELLQGHPQGGRAATAVSLGVDAGEAPALVHAARMRRRLNSKEREAAEEVQDAWTLRHIRRAARLASLLPTDGGRDPLLANHLIHIANLAKEMDTLLVAAQRREGEGDVEAASEVYLRVSRLAADSERALRGLVRTHRPAEGASAPLTAELTPEAVKLAWANTMDDTEVTAWRVIRLERLPRHGPAPITEIQGRTASRSAQDARPPFGSEVRYAAFPLSDGFVDGPPLVSQPLLLTPEVSDLRLVDGREHVTATWTRPPGAACVDASVTGPDGDGVETAVGEGGFAVCGLRDGTYRVRVSCRYRTADGREVRSPGLEESVTVHPWPSPVHDLTATARDGGVVFSWTGGEDAEVRLVEWPGEAPTSGTELQLATSELPSPLPWRETASGVLVPPPGALVCVTAVAVRGERALAGPSVRIEAPPPVAAMAAERIAHGRARITFDWPTGVRQVTVSAEQEGHCTEHRVMRSGYLREGLTLPVGPSGVRLTAFAAASTTDAVLVPPAPTATVLPADAAIAYRVTPGSRRALRRSPPTVRVTLSSFADGLAADLPEFVLVARPSTGSSPIRPRDPADGTTVLRLSGEELHRARSIEREIGSDVCRPPYALRGFLLGGKAAFVRLEEPSPATLVVR